MPTVTGHVYFGAGSGPPGGPFQNNPYTHCHVTVVIVPRFGPFTVALLETDCAGAFTFSVPDETYSFWAATGHWIQQGQKWILDTGDYDRHACCHDINGNFYGSGLPFLGYWLQPPNSSYQITYGQYLATGSFGIAPTGSDATATCAALISGNWKTCAGIGVLLTDGCGRQVQGTTRADGFLVMDAYGDLNLSIASLFDWSQISAVSVTNVPSAGSFTTGSVGGIPPGAIPAFVQTLCICNPPILRIDVTAFLGHSGDIAATNTSNLHHPFLGHYVRFAASSGGILAYRSDFATPPFAIKEKQVSNVALDVDPHGAYDKRLSRLYCVFSRSGNPSGAYSDDDGETWSDGGTAPGTYPRIAIDPYTGDTLRAGYSGGNLNGTIQAEGELTPSAIFTFRDDTGGVIVVEDDSFDIVKLPGNLGQWAGVWRVKDSGTCSVWLSADDTATWRKSYDCLEGGSRPRLEVDMYTGDLLITAFQANTLIGVFQAQGEAECSDVFTLDLGGAIVQDTTHDVSKAATEPASRWVLTAMVGSDTTPSEWFSGDDGRTFKRVGS